jgi:hypothetical protein
MEVGKTVQVVGPALKDPGLDPADGLPAPGVITEINEGGSWPIVVQLTDGPLIKTTRAGIADRTLAEWKVEVDADMHLINHYLRETDRAGEQERPLRFALALKEARRLQKDIYRVARDVYGLSREDIDAIGPL